LVPDGADSAGHGAGAGAGLEAGGGGQATSFDGASLVAVAGFPFGADLRFCAGAAAAGCNSTKSGLGVSRGGPAFASGSGPGGGTSVRTETVCDLKPASASVTPNSALPGGTVSSQGVRQDCPSEVFASAPGGSDSILSASAGGAERMKLKPGSAEEHAATVKPHARTAMTRLMVTDPEQV
jgi:hypothetical protein